MKTLNVTTVGALSNQNPTYWQSLLIFFVCNAIKANTSEIILQFWRSSVIALKYVVPLSSVYFLGLLKLFMIIRTILLFDMGS